jgi:methionyl-tRNA synthetase
MFVQKKFYVTTPIYYVSGNPHIGHAFTTVAADVMARWHRLCGEDVFFLTGTDEHGEKIEKAARNANRDTQAFVDEIAGRYVDLWKVLNISYDKFIRTTDPKHMEAVVKFLLRLDKSGDVYKGTYSGWYCVPDETFFTDTELVNGKCPECGRGVEKVEEENYFFRLSKYQDKLLALYKSNPDFILPKERANEIINRVKGGLNDISISRKSVAWGVPFPLDKTHTTYVWVDALINYISALGWPGGEKFKRYWPADVHLMGKEISWFHSVIWPALLLSAGEDLPKAILSHGWWTVEGEKMSKSRGNFVDPAPLTKKYSLDAFRYFLIREKPLSSDGDFSEHALIARINGELVADLGNLVYRVLSLAERFGGSIEGEDELGPELDVAAIKAGFDRFDVYGALEEIWKFVRSTNKYINDRKVWELKDKAMGNALYNLLEATRVIGILLCPFMPDTSQKIADQLGVKLGGIKDCSFGKFNGTVKKGSYLFNKVDVKEVQNGALAGRRSMDIKSLKMRRLDVRANLAALLAFDIRVAKSNPSLLPLDTQEKLLDFLVTDYHSETWMWGDPKGNYVAYVSLIDEPADGVVEVLRICVDPDFQRMGIGRLMMEFAEREALRLGRKRMKLVTNKKNVNAIGFYKRLGYKIIKEMPNYYGDGETRYLCEKPLHG